MSAILSEAVQRRRKRGVEFPIDFGLHAPRSLVGPIHPCCSVRVLIVHRVPACAALRGRLDGRGQRGDGGESAHCPPARARPSAHSLSSVGAAAASDRAHHYTTNSKWPLRLPLCLSLSLSEASPAPVHRRRVVASGSGMDGRTGERAGKFAPRRGTHEGALEGTTAGRGT